MRRSGFVTPAICSLLTLASVEAGQPQLTPTTSTWLSKTASGKAAATRVTAVRLITELRPTEYRCWWTEVGKGCGYLESRQVTCGTGMVQRIAKRCAQSSVPSRPPTPPFWKTKNQLKISPENAAYFSFRGGVAWGFAESNLWSGLGAD